MWRALEDMKRQDGLGVPLESQRRPVRPYDSWGLIDAISDQNGSKSLLGSPLVSRSNVESVLGYEEAGWTRRTFNESASPSVTIRQLEGKSCHVGPGELGKLA